MAITAAQITVDGTSGGVALAAASDSARTITVKNTDATATNTAVLGPSGVAAGTGFALAGGATETFQLKQGDELYAIRGTANSVVVHVLRT
jgi:hypothetical protein